MKKLLMLLLQSIFLLTFLAACGPDNEAINATVVVQVADAVQATASALPTSTNYPTATIAPTNTPLATATSQATATPLPSLTPLATASAYPTATPFPTIVITPTLTATTIAAPSSGATALPAPLDTFSAVRNAVTIARNQLNLLIQFVSNGRQGSIDCREAVTAFQIFSAPPEIDVSDASDDVANAYAVLLDSVEVVANPDSATTAFANDCQEHLNASEDPFIYNTSSANGVITEILEIRDNLQVVVLNLGGE